VIDVGDGGAEVGVGSEGGRGGFVVGEWAAGFEEGGVLCEWGGGVEEGCGIHADGEDDEGVGVGEGGFVGPGGGGFDDVGEGGDEAFCVGTGVAEEGHTEGGIVGIFVEIDGGDIEGGGMFPVGGEEGFDELELKGSSGGTAGTLLEGGGEGVGEEGGEGRGVEEALEVGAGVLGGEGVGALPTYIEEGVIGDEGVQWGAIGRQGNGGGEKEREGEEGP
jgi:hypothetical protein